MSVEIFVLPSKFEELSIAEAMNVGLHIIYTPVGGLPEILQLYGPKSTLKTGSACKIKAAILRLTNNLGPIVAGQVSIEYTRIYYWKSIIPRGGKKTVRFYQWYSIRKIVNHLLNILSPKVTSSIPTLVFYFSAKPMTSITTGLLLSQNFKIRIMLSIIILLH